MTVSLFDTTVGMGQMYLQKTFSLSYRETEVNKLTSLLKGEWPTMNNESLFFYSI